LKNSKFPHTTNGSENGVANQLGIVIDEKNAPAAYAGCLVKVMGSDGIQVPESIFPQYAETERIIQEVFK
jgi:hypothetical protein